MRAEWKFGLVALVLSFSNAEAAPGGGGALAQNVATSVVERSNITVKGHDAKMRMAIASIAGNMSSELNALLKQDVDDSRERPLYIEMYEKGDAPRNQGVRSKVTPFDDTELVIDLLVDTRDQVDRGVLSQGIIEMLLYRRGLVDRTTLEDGQVPKVPAWLSHGLMSAMAWKKDSSQRKVYEQLLKNPTFFPLANVFSATGRQVRRFDSTDTAFFQAASCAMVMAMLRQEGGAEAMQSFIEDVVLFDGETEGLLRKHFPDAAIGKNAIQKTWSLQLAEMSSAKLVESLTLAESEQKLLEVLVLTLEAEDGRTTLVPFDSFDLIKGMKLKQRVTASDAMRHGLVQLSNRCHPLYRPLLVEYVDFCKAIQVGDYGKLEERFVELQRLRNAFVEQDARCRDYLDWFQISRAHEVRGDFSGYMKLKQQLVTERELRKDEVIDPYLDRVQSLMGAD